MAAGKWREKCKFAASFPIEILFDGLRKIQRDGVKREIIEVPYKIMNFFVLSPNVYNDRVIEPYINEMKIRSIVIMGWSKGDSRWAKMFSDTMKIGDCIIVARGANKNKQVYFAGIISSEVMPYTESRESMLREISHLTDLENTDIPFNEKCAYGASKRLTSIYQLKTWENEADLTVANAVSCKIMETISKSINKKTLYSLQEISSWSQTDNKQVAIPGVQRGLVWKPAQVELLWDSILRGFPIGTFTLSESDSSDTSKSDSKYYLLDGQQRFNAIDRAYKFDRELCNSIIWLDIAPKFSPNSTRKFMVRVTTLAHPWGYKTDDNCSTLTTNEKREILKIIGRDNVYKKTILPIECFPACSGMPIPLAWFLSAPTDNEDSFCLHVLDKIKNLSETIVYMDKILQVGLKKKELSVSKENIAEFYPVFKRIKQYRVGVSILSKESLDNNVGNANDSKIVENANALETLFRRIGTGGSPISQEELNYSAIKTYWPSSVRKENDKIAANYMPPERLIRLVFRLALSDSDSMPFKNDLTIIQIRKIGIEQGADFKKIMEWYQENDSKVGKIMKIVDNWMLYDNCPKFIRTSVVRNSPDVYLLLMYIADHEDLSDISNSQIQLLQGLALYIHWFVADKNKIKIANIIKSQLAESSKGWEQKIRIGIGTSIHQELMPICVAPNNIQLEIGCEPKWNAALSEKVWGQTWCSIAYNKEMLLFAEREYIKEKFPNYDPANKGMWEQHNRPWDMDHIVPQNWIANKQSKYREYCKRWLWLNGNFAAISFEANRSKSDEPDWTEYDKNKDSLLFDEEVKKIDKRMTFCEEQSHLFAEITFKRTIAIYNKCFPTLSLILQTNYDLNDVINKRRVLFTKIKDKLTDKEGINDVEVRWTDINSSQCEFTMDFCEEIGGMKDINWYRPWLTVGFIPDKSHYICVCTQDGNTLEIGVRKHPNEQVLNGEPITIIDGYNNNNSNWWYLVKEIQYENNIDKICDELELLNKHIALPMHKES